MFPDAHIIFDDHVSHRTSIGSRATGSGPKKEKTLPLTLRFASVGGKFSLLACSVTTRMQTLRCACHAAENVQHTLYGLEALIYKLSVLVLAVSLALLGTVDFKSMGDTWLQEASKSAFLCAILLRIVTPLQSLSALFIADIGRYVGHTPAELQEIRYVL